MKGSGSMSSEAFSIFNERPGTTDGELTNWALGRRTVLIDSSHPPKVFVHRGVQGTFDSECLALQPLSYQFDDDFIGSKF